MKSCGFCCPRAAPPAPVVLATSSAMMRAVALKIRLMDMNAFSLPDEKLPRAESRGRAGATVFSSTQNGGLRMLSNETVVGRKSRTEPRAMASGATLPEEIINRDGQDKQDG